MRYKKKLCMKRPSDSEIVLVERIQFFVRSFVFHFSSDVVYILISLHFLRFLSSPLSFVAFFFSCFYVSHNSVVNFHCTHAIHFFHGAQKCHLCVVFCCIWCARCVNDCWHHDSLNCRNDKQQRERRQKNAAKQEQDRERMKQNINVCTTSVTKYKW